VKESFDYHALHSFHGSLPLTTTNNQFNGPLSRTTRVSRYQKGKTDLDFTEARDSEWQWQQLGHMQVCISLQADNHASTPPLSFLQAGCPSCRPTNSVKALKALEIVQHSLSNRFFLCGTMLAQYLLWCVHLSVHHRPVIISK